MPIYTYMCRECDTLSDVRKSMLAADPETCPACGKASLYQKIHPPAIHFRGSGFYSADKKIDEITDPEYQLSEADQIAYYDEKLANERTVKIFT